MRPSFTLLANATLLVVSSTVRLPAQGPAQTLLTRRDAIAAALARGPRIAVARADTAIAGASLVAARAWPNPALSASYSKSTPEYHVSLDVPLDLWSVRGLRVQSAEASVRAAQLGFVFAHAMIEMDADTTYTRAVAARERVALSQRTAMDADSLLRMAERRRDAGDASDLDVELARVNAGQQANVAAGDSLAMVSAFLDLQGVIGSLDDRVAILPADSLVEPPSVTPAAPLTVPEAAAAAALDAATLATRMQHRSIWSQFSVAAGVEYKDPDMHGLLPTLGLGVGLPLFDRNRGAIAQANAERERARAELSLARVTARMELARATRERDNAMARLARDRTLVASAERVAAMSLTAYREGASSLPNVLEAQRSARDVRAQTIDDLAAAWIAAAELRVFSLNPTQAIP